MRVENVAFSPDGRLLAAAASSSDVDTSSQVFVWTTAGWRRRGTASLGGRSPRALAFTPDGGQLVVAAGTATDPSHILRLVADDLEELDTFDATQQVQDLVPDPDGRSLLLAGGDRGVQRRALDDGRLLGELGQHPSTVRALALSPDGRALATVTAADPLVRLWDARTGAPLAQLTGHDGYPNAVAFSPEGGLLASGGEDGAVILWPLDPAGAVQRICRVLATARPAEGLPVPDECR